MDGFRDQTIDIFGGAGSQPLICSAEIVEALSGEEFGNDATFLWRRESCERYFIAYEPSRSIVERIERSLEAD